MAARDLAAQDLTPKEATSRARREFGNVGLVKETTRELTTWTALDSIGKDLRYAARILAKSPGFSFTVIAALALGIGVNAAVFSAVRSVLLRPLPFPNPQQLVRVWESFGLPGNYEPVSLPNFQDWRRWSRSFNGMTAYHSVSLVLTGAGAAAHLDGTSASASLFDLLQARPLIGRTFVAADDQPGSNRGTNSIVLSHGLWQERFGSDSKILGRVLMLDGKPFTVIGVMPAGFRPPVGSDANDFWITTAILAEPSPGSPKPLSQERSISFLQVIGRLKPGVSMAAARADMSRVASMLTRTYPKDDGREGVLLEDWQRNLTGDTRPTLQLLFAATGTLLLMVVANLASLFSARIARRHQEMNIRAAIGAGRWRIMRQLFTEALLLSATGLGVGLLLAWAAASKLLPLLNADGQPTPQISAAVFGFGALLAVAAAALLSLAPALHVYRPDLMRAIRESSLSAGASRTQRRFQNVSIIAQLCLATVLLSGAGLFADGLIALARVNLGFEPKHALAFPVSLPDTRYSQAERGLASSQLEQTIRRIPGVLSVGAGEQLPLSSMISNTVLDRAGKQFIPESQRTITYAAVSGDYFRALGMRLERGRVFTGADSAAAEPVVILNETAARKYFSSRSPVGEPVEPVMWNGAGSQTRPRTVVGVVADVKLEGIGSQARPTVYWPIEQIPSNDTLFVVVRTEGEALGVVPALRSCLHSFDPDLPLYQVRTLSSVVDSSLAEPFHLTALIGCFAVLALILTTVGVFGTVAYNVAGRTREIGIRMALGAGSGSVMRKFVGQAATLSGAGLALGVAGSIGASHLLQHQFSA